MPNIGYISKTTLLLPSFFAKISRKYLVINHLPPIFIFNRELFQAEPVCSEIFSGRAGPGRIGLKISQAGPGRFGLEFSQAGPGRFWPEIFSGRARPEDLQHCSEKGTQGLL